MINKRPNRCEGCDKSFGDGPGMAKRSKGAGPLSEKAVCANCERWQYRHPTLTMADRRRKLFGPADSGATVVALIEDVHWRQKATCKNANPAIFDVDEDAPNYTERHMLAATKYCANCPVLMECLADRAANPSYSLGVRGGIYFPLATNNSGKARKPIDLLRLAAQKSDTAARARARANERRRKSRAEARAAREQGAA